MRSRRILSFLLAALLAAGLLAGCGEAPAQETPAPAPVPTAPPTPEPTERPLRDAVLSDSTIDAALLDTETDEHGTLDIIEYKTYDYSYESKPEVMKKAAVYLPYGYDEGKAYDVLFLLHTASADSYFWLVYDHYMTDTEGNYRAVSVCSLLDIMISKGYCRPLIVVAPDCYLGDEERFEHNSERDFSQFAKEFPDDLLPYVAENYATYAGSGSHEDLVKAREHFGVLGSSFGAYMAYRSLLGRNFDIVSDFCLTGGGEVEPWWLDDMWENLGMQDYSLHCLYFAEGEYDDRGPVETGYYMLLDYGWKFTGENTALSLLYGTGHEDREWVTALYNSLQMFFRD